MRVTVACPTTLISDANNLAMVLAFGPPDGDTYGEPIWQDAQGNQYTAASFIAQPEWIIGAQSALQRPAWDTEQLISLAAARRAQAAMVFWQPGASAAPIARPDKLTALAWPEGPDALAMMGLTPTPAKDNL